MTDSKEFLAVGINAIEVFEHPQDSLTNTTTGNGGLRQFKEIGDTSFTSFSRFSQRRGAPSTNESCISANSSFGNSTDALSSLEGLSKTVKLAEEDVLRIKMAVAKGKACALANVKRIACGAKLVDWRTTTGVDDQDADDCNEHLTIKVLPRRDYDDNSIEVISRYSDPKRRLAPELAPDTTIVVDGEMRMTISREEIQYRKKVNTIRINKLKEMFLALLVDTEEFNQVSQIFHNGSGHLSSSIDMYDVAFQSAGVDINPDPTYSEMIQCKTPARNGDHLPKDLEPSAENPFTSLFSGSLKVQKEEFANDDEDEQERAFRGPSHNIDQRFRIHDEIQQWLRKAHKDAQVDKRNWSATRVAREILSEIEDMICQQYSLDSDDPLGADKDSVPRERHARPTSVQWHTHSLAFITAWVERCERNQW
jgi:hypothetical protein